MLYAKPHFSRDTDSNFPHFSTLINKKRFQAGSTGSTVSSTTGNNTAATDRETRENSIEIYSNSTRTTNLPETGGLFFISLLSPDFVFHNLRSYQKTYVVYVSQS